MASLGLNELNPSLQAARLPPEVREQARSVWQHFKDAAGADWQVDAFELKKFLNGQFIQG